MILLLAVLALALAAALALVAGALWRRWRAACAAIGADGGDLLGAIRRSERESVPRAHLSEALASRDAVMSSSTSPTLVFDSAGGLLRANRAAREALPGLGVGDTADRVAVLEPLRAVIADALAGRPTVPVELTVYEPERRRFQASVRGYAAADGHACVVTMQDHSSEADYRDARRLFSAGVSHELRTPLARVLALVETLALPLDEDGRTATIEQARLEVDGMRRLIDDMVLLVRLESHELPGGLEPVDVAAAVEAALDRHRPAAADRGMPLSAEVTGGLVVSVPARLLDAVLDNLVENALRHAGAGASVQVQARGLAGAVELIVADTGVGIPAEHLPRVFERFYRVESARSGPGTGLGLAIVKHIAEEYGGRATAEVVPGSGTRIRVVLPAPAAARRGFAGSAGR
ncbi:MAG TPA: ATP-binding protein [Gaiellales bacterium]|nr:ATP-binding protein [Gaiellales bacterium]